VIVQGRRVGHHEVRDVVESGPVASDQGEVQFRRVSPQDDEPGRVTVGEGHRHPQDVLVEGKGPADVADRDSGGETSEGNAGHRAPRNLSAGWGGARLASWRGGLTAPC